MNKKLILKTLNDAILKCGKSNPYTLSYKDKEFIDNLNLTDYHEDIQHDDYNNILEELEFIQDDYQNELKFSENEINELMDYTQINYEFVNERLYEEDYKYNNMLPKDDIDKSIRILTRALNKGEGLLENTILHRYGFWDETMKEGDIGVFKGFTSTSYQKNETEMFNMDDRRQIKIYTPAGTKGLVLNTDNGLSIHDEHEFLLNKGLRYYVLSTNKEEVEIVLLPS